MHNFFKTIVSVALHSRSTRHEPSPVAVRCSSTFQQINASVSADLLEAKHLKRFLRHRRTNAYFTGAGWTDNPLKAKHFETVLSAVRACTDLGLGSIDLIIRYEAQAPDACCVPIV